MDTSLATMSLTEECTLNEFVIQACYSNYTASITAQGLPEPSSLRSSTLHLVDVALISTTENTVAIVNAGSDHSTAWRRNRNRRVN